MCMLMKVHGDFDKIQIGELDAHKKKDIIADLLD